MAAIKWLKVRGNSLYIQTTLPPKPGSEYSGPSRQAISTGLKDTPAGRAEFRRLVRKLEDQLDRGTFDWREWGWTPPSLDRDKVVERLRLQCQDSMTFDTWYRWTLVFRRLPEGQLTPKVLVDVLSQWAVDSALYWRYSIALKALGKVAWGEEFELEAPRPTYSRAKVKARELPLDADIEAAVDALEEPHRWVAGVLATYGLRPHELFHFEMEEGGVALVSDGTKTGQRIVYPVPKAWWERWDLKERRWPSEWNAFLTEGGRLNHLVGTSTHKDVEAFNSQGNSRLPDFLRKQLRRRKFGITPYNLRHAYALRCMRVGVPTAIAARMMGHSEKIHIETYRKWLSTEMVRDFMEML